MVCGVGVVLSGTYNIAGYSKKEVQAILKPVDDWSIIRTANVAIILTALHLVAISSRVVG